jgi:hypothetical protein
MDEMEVIESGPSDTYLTGILWPRGNALEPIEDDTGESAPDDDAAATDAAVPGYRAIRPCSIGITFAVDMDVAVKIDLGKTSRYRLSIDGEAKKAGGSTGRRRWTRTPLGYAINIPPSATSSERRENSFITRNGEVVEDLSVTIHVKRRVAGDQQTFTVTLINSLEAVDSQRDAACLFQTELIVRAVHDSGVGAIRPRPNLSMGGDEDAQSNAMLYRDVKEFAIGHGIGSMWDPSARISTSEVKTAWLPVLSVKGTSAKGHEFLAGFNKKYSNALRAEWIGREDARDEVLTAMLAFSATYRKWIEEELAAKLSDLDDQYQAAAMMNLARCRNALRRINMGIETLKSNDSAWKAFSLANAAMDRQAQFKSKELANRRPLTWRPFQLAYFLMVLPGIIDDRQPDRDCMDLLWFPTGGGKTEAYLGLTAFQIFFRRLVDDGRRRNGGVDVMMRYTLRLLTVQQFQRAAALICACDMMRDERSDLGAAPISLGLYVGGEATPNRMVDAGSALAEELAGAPPKSTPCQLLRCPVCGGGLSASSYEISSTGQNVEITCREAGCEMQARRLPVLTVDEAIYSSPPSLLIGTIDKFAQLPRRTDIRRLFGLDEGLPPGLIIQDELHLISGPLGSIAGLYETIIDLLSTRGGVRPKVIGSTATIGQAAKQVRALFDRSVMQFPPAGFDAADSFFAVRDDDGEDRIYMGVASAGRSPKFALQAVSAALLQGASSLLQAGLPLSQLDAYWTCVLYFNSLRELGSAYVLMLDDVPRQMTFLASRFGDERRLLEQEPMELSSRVSSRDLPAKLQSLQAQLEQSDDPYAPLPVDTVLASNMISVGVDVSRLGLMVVNGQPKSTAEYIQASSRVGRGIEGLVVTVYNFGRPRDLSHFEHFSAYHSALYRSVEATSVTPWAPRARDKALHVVVASVIRHLVDGMDADEAAGRFDANDPDVVQLIRAIAARAASSSVGIEADDTEKDIAAIIRKWARRSQDAKIGNSRLLYWERKAPFGKTAPHLMYSAEDGGTRANSPAWSTPNSMRDVEPSTAFRIKNF